MKGIVKWFDASRGYGFITRDNESDLFVHYSEIKMDGYKELKDGDEVEFDVAHTQKGDLAKNVRIV